MKRVSMLVGVTAPRCGVRDYAAALCAALPPDCARMVEVPTPPGHLYRHRLPALVQVRHAVRRAARGLESPRRSAPPTLGSPTDKRWEVTPIVHAQYSDFSWNGVRPFEDLYEVFTRQCRAPMVVTLHEHPWFRNEHEWDRPRTAADHAFLGMASIGGGRAGPQAVLRRHRGIHVHHRWQADVLTRNGIPPERIFILPHPVLPTASGLPPAAFLQQFGLQGKRLLVMTGFIFERKRHDRALELLPGLPEDVVLCVLGGPNGAASEAYTDRLRRRAGELGVERRFVISDYLSEPQLAAGMAAATVLLAPYGEVTSSGSILRGLAVAPPVVAADGASFVEMQEDGAGLVCVDMTAGQTFYEAVRRVLDDPAHAAELRVRNRSYAEQNSMASFAGQMAKWYGEVGGRQV